MDEPSEEKTHEKVSKANAIFTPEVCLATDVRAVLVKSSRRTYIGDDFQGVYVGLMKQLTRDIRFCAATRHAWSQAVVTNTVCYAL